MASAAICVSLPAPAALPHEATTASDRTWLIKRIVWHLQVSAEGNLSERAQRRTAERARDTDLACQPK